METNKQDALDDENKQKQVRLVDIPITDDNTALHVVVSFLNLAQRRGAYTFDESAKILECIQYFKRG